jgi:hypothetical protein
MNTQVFKSPKPVIRLNQSPTKSSSAVFSFSMQLANIGLKQQIMLSLKLAYHDTHQAALEKLRSIMQSLPPGSSCASQLPLSIIL